MSKQRGDAAFDVGAAREIANKINNGGGPDDFSPVADDNGNPAVNITSDMRDLVNAMTARDNLGLKADIGLNPADYPNIQLKYDANNREYRAAAQSQWEKGWRAVWTGVTSGAYTFAEDLGYIGEMLSGKIGIKDQDEISRVFDDMYSADTNMLSEWARENKDDLRKKYPIYAKADGTVDLTDSGFNWMLVRDILDSIVGFAGAGATVAGAVGKAGKLLSMAGRASKGLRSASKTNAFARLLTSPTMLQSRAGTAIVSGAVTNYAEGKMIAYDTFEATMDQMDPYIKSGQLSFKDGANIAGHEANKIQMKNAAIMFTDMIAIGGAIRGIGYTRSIIKNRPNAASQLGKIFGKQGFIEAGEEYYQGLIQKEATYQAMEQVEDRVKPDRKERIDELKGTSRIWMKRTVNNMTDPQILVEAMMGYFGGAGQFAMMSAIGGSDLKREQQLYDDQQDQIAINKEYIEKYLDEVGTIDKEIERAMLAGQDERVKILKDIRMYELIVKSLMNGVIAGKAGDSKGLINMAQDIAESSDDPKVKKNAEELIQRAKEMEVDWMTSSAYRANQLDVFYEIQQGKIYENAFNRSKAAVNDLYKPFDERVKAMADAARKRTGEPIVGGMTFDDLKDPSKISKSEKERRALAYNIIKTREFKALKKLSDEMDGYAEKMEESNKNFDKITSPEYQKKRAAENEKAAKENAAANKKKNGEDKNKKKRWFRRKSKNISKNEEKAAKDEKEKESKLKDNARFNEEFGTQGPIASLMNMVSDPNKASEEMTKYIDELAAKYKDPAAISEEYKPIIDFLSGVDKNRYLDDVAYKGTVDGIMSPRVLEGFDTLVSNLMNGGKESEIPGAVSEATNKLLANGNLSEAEAKIFHDYTQALAERVKVKWKENNDLLQKTKFYKENKDLINSLIRTLVSDAKTAPEIMAVLANEFFEGSDPAGPIFEDIMNTIRSLTKDLKIPGKASGVYSESTENDIKEETAAIEDLDRLNDAVASAAYNARAYNQPGGFLGALFEDVSNDLNESADVRLMHPDSIKLGANVNGFVEEDYTGDIYYTAPSSLPSMEQYNGNVPWSEVKNALNALMAGKNKLEASEARREYVDNMPVRLEIEDSLSDAPIVTYMHATEWIQANRVNGGEEEAAKQREEMRALRQSLVENNIKEFTTNIDFLGTGKIFFDKNKSVAPFSDNIQDESIQIFTRNDNKLIDSGSKKTDATNGINIANRANMSRKNGKSFAMLQSGKADGSFIAVPLYNQKLGPEAVESITRAVGIFYKVKDGKNITEEEQAFVEHIDEYLKNIELSGQRNNFDITTEAGLRNYIELFTYNQYFFNSTKNRKNEIGAPSNLAEYLNDLQDENIPAIRVHRDGVDFGRSGEGRVVNSKDYRNSPEQYLENLAKHLEGTYSHVDVRMRGKKMSVPISDHGSLETLGDGSYDAYMKKYVLGTNFKTVPVSIGGKTKYLHTIQRVVGFNKSFAPKSDDQVAEEKSNKPDNTVTADQKTRLKTIRSLLNKADDDGNTSQENLDRINTLFEEFKAILEKYPTMINKNTDRQVKEIEDGISSLKPTEPNSETPSKKNKATGMVDNSLFEEEEDSSTEGENDQNEDGEEEPPPWDEEFSFADIFGTEESVPSNEEESYNKAMSMMDHLIGFTPKQHQILIDNLAAEYAMELVSGFKTIPEIATEITDAYLASKNPKFRENAEKIAFLTLQKLVIDFNLDGKTATRDSEDVSLGVSNFSGDEESMYVDPKDKLSRKIKLLFYGVQNPKGQGIGNFKEIIPMQRIYYDLMSLVHGSRSIKEILAIITDPKIVTRFPYMKEVAERIQDDTTGQEKRQLLVAMQKQRINMNYVFLTMDAAGNTTIGIAKDNSSEYVQYRKKIWRDSIYGSKLAIDDPRVPGSIIANKIIAEQLVEQFDEWFENIDEVTPSPEVVKTWLDKMGLNVSLATLVDMKENGFKELGDNSTFIWEDLFRGFGLFSAITMDLKEIAAKKEKAMPLESYKFWSLGSKKYGSLALANWPFDDHVIPHTFTSGGKRISGFQDPTFISDQMRDIEKRDFSRWKDKVFAENSFWLDQLQEEGSKMATLFKTLVVSKNPLNTGKTRNQPLENLDEASHDQLMWYYYQNSGSDMKNFYSMTFSNKKNMLLFHALSKSYTFDLNGVVDDDAYEDLYNMLFVPEANRMLVVKDDEEYNNNSYANGRSIFYFLPKINDISELFEDGVLIENYEFHKDKIITAIKESVADLHTKRITSWEENEIVVKDSDGKETFIIDVNHKNALESKISGIVSTETLKNAAAYDFEINYLIARANMFQVMYGDIANYYVKGDDISKSIEATFDNAEKRLAAEIAPGYLGDNSEERSYNTLVVSDVVAESRSMEYYELLRDEKYLTLDDIAAYENILSTDAGELISLKEHVELMYDFGKITRKMANHYIKQAKAMELTREEIGFLFKVTKPVQVAVLDEGEVERKVYIKSAAFPLIPQLVEGTELEKVANFMEKNNIDRIAPASAVKIGRPELAKLFNEDKTFNEDIDISRSVLVLPRTTLRIQQETPEKDPLVKRFTQATKLAFLNAMDISGLKIRGDKNTYNSKELYEKFMKILATSANISKEKLEYQLLDEDGNLDYQALSARLKRSAEALGFSKHQIEAFSNYDDSHFMSPLWLLSGSNSFESVLNSIVNRSVVEERIPGYSHKLISEEGWVRDTDKGLTENGVVFTPEWKGHLRSIEEESGLRTYDVILPWSFAGVEMSDFIGDDGKIDMDKIDSDILTMFGVRIPVQSQKSMAAIRVVGFLPRGSDVIIASRDLVVKTGQDFDYDAFYSYMYNVYTDANGKLKIFDEKVYGFFKGKGLSGLGRAYKAAKVAMQDLKDTGAILKVSGPDNIAEKVDPVELDAMMRRLDEGKGTEEDEELFRSIGAVTEARTKKQKELKNKIALLGMVLNGKAHLQNQLIDIHLAMHQSDEVSAIQSKALDSKELKDLAKMVKSKTATENNIYISAAYQSSVYRKSSGAKDMVGIMARLNVFYSMVQTSGIEMKYYNKKSKKVVALGWAKKKGNPMINAKRTGTGLEGNPLRSELLSQLLSASVDDVSLQILGAINLSPRNVDIVKGMFYQGHDFKAMVQMLNQPAVIQAVKLAGKIGRDIGDTKIALKVAAGKLITQLVPQENLEEESVKTAQFLDSRYLDQQIGRNIDDLSDADKIKQARVLRSLRKFLRMASEIEPAEGVSNIDSNTTSSLMHSLEIQRSIEEVIPEIPVTNIAGYVGQWNPNGKAEDGFYPVRTLANPERDMPFKPNSITGVVYINGILTNNNLWMSNRVNEPSVYFYRNPAFLRALDMVRMITKTDKASPKLAARKNLGVAKAFINFMTADLARNGASAASEREALLSPEDGVASILRELQKDDKYLPLYQYLKFIVNKPSVDMPYISSTGNDRETELRIAFHLKQLYINNPSLFEKIMRSELLVGSNTNAFNNIWRLISPVVIRLSGHAKPAYEYDIAESMKNVINFNEDSIFRNMPVFIEQYFQHSPNEAQALFAGDFYVGETGIRVDEAADLDKLYEQIEGGEKLSIVVDAKNDNYMYDNTEEFLHYITINPPNRKPILLKRVDTTKSFELGSTVSATYVPIPSMGTLFRGYRFKEYEPNNEARVSVFNQLGSKKPPLKDSLPPPHTEQDIPVEVIRGPIILPPQTPPPITMDDDPLNRKESEDEIQKRLTSDLMNTLKADLLKGEKEVPLGVAIDGMLNSDLSNGTEHEGVNAVLQLMLDSNNSGVLTGATYISENSPKLSHQGMYIKSYYASPPVVKIISGGQTGADLAGLEFAESRGIVTGGTAPKGFKTEAGPNMDLGAIYGLEESESTSYSVRTKKNIDDSDATVLFGNPKSAGSAQTIKMANESGKPILVNPNADQLRQFLIDKKVKVLNIAGNRRSTLSEQDAANIPKVLFGAFITGKIKNKLVKLNAPRIIYSQRVFGNKGNNEFVSVNRIFTHEVAHAFTAGAIYKPSTDREFQFAGRIDTLLRAAVSALSKEEQDIAGSVAALYSRKLNFTEKNLLDKFGAGDQFVSNLDPDEKKKLSNHRNKIFKDTGIDYATMKEFYPYINAQEFVAGFFTSAPFLNRLNSIPSIFNLKEDAGVVKTIFRKVVDAIIDLFGIKKNTLAYDGMQEILSFIQDKRMPSKSILTRTGLHVLGHNETKTDAKVRIKKQEKKKIPQPPVAGMVRLKDSAINLGAGSLLNPTHGKNRSVEAMIAEDLVKAQGLDLVDSDVNMQDTYANYFIYFKEGYVTPAELEKRHRDKNFDSPPDANGNVMYIGGRLKKMNEAADGVARELKLIPISDKESMVAKIKEAINDAGLDRIFLFSTEAMENIGKENIQLIKEAINEALLNFPSNEQDTQAVTKDELKNIPVEEYSDAFIAKYFNQIVSSMESVNFVIKKCD